MASEHVAARRSASSNARAHSRRSRLLRNNDKMRAQIPSAHALYARARIRSPSLRSAAVRPISRSEAVGCSPAAHFADVHCKREQAIFGGNRAL